MTNLLKKISIMLSIFSVLVLTSCNIDKSVNTDTLPEPTIPSISTPSTSEPEGPTTSEPEGPTTSEPEIIYVEKEVCLSDITPTYFEVGYGGSYFVDKDMDGNPLSLLVDGVETQFEKGFFAHAYSVLAFDFYSEVLEFNTSFGIGLSARGRKETDIKFSVIIDDEIIYESDTINKDNPTGSINLEINRYVRRIILVIDDLGSNGLDHALWAAPMIKYMEAQKV